MAKKYRIQLKGVTNNGASATSLVDLPIGKRYHEIIIEHGYASGTNTVAAAATNVSEIRLLINGRVQRTFSGTELRDLNLLNGTAYDFTGVPNTAPGVAMPIFFSEPSRKDARDQDNLALATVWKGGEYDSVQLEIVLSSASTPTLTVSAVVDNVVPDQQMPFTKILRKPFAASGTSYDINGLDKRDWLTQISLYKDSGGTRTISKVTLRQNGEILHELSGTANTALLLWHGMAPAASGRTAGIYDVVLDHDDLLGSAVQLNGSRDVTLTIEATGGAMSGTTTALIQRIGFPE
jgi:hypothetical protein